MSVEIPSNFNRVHTTMSNLNDIKVHTTMSNLNEGYHNDTLNPYFIHPNENPALVLITPLLNAKNYYSCSRFMTMALRSNNKLHFINGSLPRPPDKDRDYRLGSLQYHDYVMIKQLC